MHRNLQSWIILVSAAALASCGGEVPFEGEGAGDGGLRGEYSTLSARQVALYARRAGIPCGERLRVAVAVAFAESSYNPRAYHRNSNGTVDKGLWQINTYYHPPRCNYYNPACNAKMMAQISSHGSNWRPWYGYGTRLYWAAYNSHAKTGAAAACGGGGGSKRTAPRSSTSRWGSCRYGSKRGTCQSTSTHCSGYYRAGLCPGPSSIRCCLPSSGSTSWGSCRYGSKRGTCQSTSTHCSGYYRAGLCPGPSSIRCCLR